MKTFLLIPLFAMLLLPVQDPPTPPVDGSQVAVVGFKWSKSHQTIQTPSDDKPLPARAVTQADKNLERNTRINDPAGKRDPNADTLDARGVALEKSVRDAQQTGKTVDAFAYQAKIHNFSKQVIEIVFWEYQFIDATIPGNVTRRQFICGINLKPDKEKDLQASSVAGPPNAVSAASLANKPDSSFQEKVIINRVEFADGKSWMRKDWNASEIKAAYQRAMATPWSSNEMCRAL
jgi:hypothetical protein